MKKPLAHYASDSEFSSGQTESLEEDSDFEVQGPLVLQPRLSKPPMPTAKKSMPRLAFEDDEFEVGLGIDEFEPFNTRNNMNENVVMGAIDRPARRLRPAASTTFAAMDEQATIRLRPAQSLGNIAGNIARRPLAVYTEKKDRKPTHKPSRRRIKLIQKPEQIAQHEVNGMVFNSQTGEWEGNDQSTNVFDTIKGRNEMLFRHTDLPVQNSASMVFDNVNLQWVPRPGIAEEDDPFAGIADLDETSSAISTPALGQSAFSTSSRRHLSASASAFNVPTSILRLWQENDARFVRKFGAWVQDDDAAGATTSAANDLFKMVN